MEYLVKPSFLFDNFLTHLAVYLTLIVGMINIFIQFHRLKTENITQNRMKWINDVRDISAEILSFDVCDFMRNNRNEIEFIIDKDIKTLTKKLKLCMNYNDEYDKKIINTITKLESLIMTIPRTSILNNHIGKHIFSNENNEEFRTLKNDLEKYIQVYLKREWDRVKSEASLWS